MTQMEQSIFSFNQISKSFSRNTVLTNVSFSLKKKQVMGLVGENGAGKSTLMNILGGFHQPDSGTMTLHGNEYKPLHPSDAQDSRIAFIHQELNLFSNLSIAENFFITRAPMRLFPFPGIDKIKMQAMTKEWLKRVQLDLPPQTLIESLSPAERQLVEIAKSLSMNAEIILFDEPTSSLTGHETQHLFKVIKALKLEGISMVYISHHLDEVFELSEEITILRDGQVAGSGESTQYSRDQIISLMVGKDLKHHIPERTSNASQKVLYEVKGLSQPSIVKDIELKVHAGEVVGLFGLVGSGRTELARILFGLDPYEKGSFKWKSSPVSPPSPGSCIKHKMAFLTENRQEEGLFLDLSVNENISQVALSNYTKGFYQRIEKKRLRKDLEQIVQATHVHCASIDDQNVKTLSGGNQQKVVLGKWLLAEPEFLILDEPTRGIDVGAKHQLYLLINDLVQKGLGILFISSEVEELMGLCDRILVMKSGEICGEIVSSDFDQEKILQMALGETS